MNILIFANCQGLEYESMLKKTKIQNLHIKRYVSYEKVNNFEEIAEDFKICDLLIIQPVKSYKDFELMNIKQTLKNNCKIIKVPYLRFNGFWLDSSDNILIKKLASFGVTIPKNINNKEDASRYLHGTALANQDIVDNFNKCYKHLKKIEDDSDLKFMEFFDNNFKKVPLFRDYSHATSLFYDHLLEEFCKALNTVLNLNIAYAGSHKKEKESGHYAPITDQVGAALNLGYELDSYYVCSRLKYLTDLLSYQNSEFPPIKTFYDFHKAVIKI